MLYVEEEVAKILEAYRALFPKNNIKKYRLDEFWDFGPQHRAHTWSCLTTNFLVANFNDFNHLHEMWQGVNRNGTPDEIAKQLRGMSNQTHVGYSIGLSPWTDRLLLDTFCREKTKKIFIILGHDWYPIVSKEKPQKIYIAETPLEVHVEEKRYLDFVPNRARPRHRTETAVLFLNFYPHFRPPSEDKEGRLKAKWMENCSYSKCRTALIDICRVILESEFQIVGVLSWSSPVWSELRNSVQPVVEGDVKEVSLGQFDQLNLTVDGTRIPYYPFPHPCRAGNFGAGHRQNYANLLNRFLGRVKDLHELIRTAPSPVILLEGIRKLPSDKFNTLSALARKLATDFPSAIFRTGNAKGADKAFAQGVNEVDPSRLQCVLPDGSLRKQQLHHLNYAVPFEKVSKVEEPAILYETRKATPAYSSLLKVYEGRETVPNERLVAKSKYLLRDTLKVLGSQELGLAKATVGIFYVNLDDPWSGGTGHTMRVCRNHGVPILDQRVWMEWL